MKHLAAHVLRAAILTSALCGAYTAAAADPSRTANQAWVLSQIAASQRADGRYPLFLLNLNPGEARVWNGVELKATTNNFDSSLVFFAASATNGDNPSVFNRDWCRLFVLTRRADSDIRRWVRIKNTAALDGYAPLVLAVLVDPDLLRRGQGTAWLRESNANLVWSYTRIGLASSETDQDGRACWRPAMPVRWYATLPEWANQPESAVDATDIVDYVAPWTEEIAAAISAIGGVTPEMVTNIVASATNALTDALTTWNNPIIVHQARSAETAFTADSASFAEQSGQANFATGAAYSDWTTGLAGETQSIRRGDEIFAQLDAAASAAQVTNIVRDLSLGGIWDNALQVWWTPRMVNGSLTYHATTNVNLNAGN